MKAAAIRLGSIPIRVHASFLFLMLILGSQLINTPQYLLILAGIVLVSILLHELGHALMGRAFGLAPEIDVHGMGGTTSWTHGKSVSNLRHVLISVAGPAVGIAIGGGLKILVAQGIITTPETVLARFALDQIIFVNFWWGVLNLLPMLPLDGGNIMAAALRSWTKGRAEKLTRIVSLAVAGGAIVLAVLYENWFGALLSASFAYTNFRALKDFTGAEHDAALQKDVDSAFDALRREDGRAVLSIAEPLLAKARTEAMRAEAIHLVAYGLLLEKRLDEADAMMKTLPPGYSPHASYAELKDVVRS